MPFIIVFVLVALLFGFVFAKLDTLMKMCKILKDDINKLQKEIEEHKNISK